MKQEKEFNNYTSTEEEKSQAIAHKDSALKRLDTSFNKHIELGEYKKSNILAYWIENFSKYHDEENNFDNSSIKTYKRGDIIKADLGFNVGNELGGLHYCVVISKKDNHSFGTINVIPLSSIKEDKEYNDYSTVNLGNELYLLLSKKLQKTTEKVMEKLKQIDLDDDNSENIKLEDIKKLTIELNNLKKLKDQITKMKNGSIALLHQITTISKQRIYNPKNNNDILAKIRLSTNSLDAIDAKLQELFIK